MRTVKADIAGIGTSVLLITCVGALLVAAGSMVGFRGWAIPHGGGHTGTLTPRAPLGTPAPRPAGPTGVAAAPRAHRPARRRPAVVALRRPGRTRRRGVSVVRAPVRTPSAAPPPSVVAPERVHPAPVPRSPAPHPAPAPAPPRPVPSPAPAPPAAVVIPQPPAPGGAPAAPGPLQVLAADVTATVTPLLATLSR